MHVYVWKEIAINMNIGWAPDMIGWAPDMIGWACAQTFPTLAMLLQEAVDHVKIFQQHNNYFQW